MEPSIPQEMSHQKFKREGVKVGIHMMHLLTISFLAKLSWMGQWEVPSTLYCSAASLIKQSDKEILGSVQYGIVIIEKLSFFSSPFSSYIVQVWYIQQLKQPVFQQHSVLLA